MLKKPLLYTLITYLVVIDQILAVNCPTSSNPFIYTIKKTYTKFSTIVHSFDNNYLLGGTTTQSKKQTPLIVEVGLEPMFELKRAYVFYIKNLRTCTSVQILAQTGEDEYRVAFEDPHATTTLDVE